MIIGAEPRFMNAAFAGEGTGIVSGTSHFTTTASLPYQYCPAYSMFVGAASNCIGFESRSPSAGAVISSVPLERTIAPADAGSSETSAFKSPSESMPPASRIPSRKRLPPEVSATLPVPSFTNLPQP